MSYLRYLRRNGKQRELDDEIESYIAITIEDNIAAGMTEEDARSAAYRKFGNTTLIKETVRDMNSINWLEDLWNDIRHGARLLKLNPSFFAVATLSLALGIGANTAIFQLLNAVRLRSLPVSQPEQLAELQIAENEHCCAGNFSTRRPSFTFAQWEQIRDHQKAFSSIFAFADARFNLAQGGEARFADGWIVSGSFFRTLGVNPALGRMLRDEDDRPGCGSPGAVISYPFWQRTYGGNPDVIGKKISLNSHPLEIVGVSAAGFFGPEVGRSYDVAVPVCAEAIINAENNRLPRRDSWWLAVIGRLNPGLTPDLARAQAEVMSKDVFEASVPPNAGPDMAKWYVQYKLTAQSAASGVSELRERYNDPLTLLLGIAGAVLLIACANLANLMLARSSVREREMAVRVAIGAGRGRLIRQMLAESALLTLAGTVFGALMAQWLSRYLVTFLSTSDTQLFLDLGIDWRMLAFTSGVAVVTCLLFGVAPAMKAASTSPGIAMKSGGRAVTADRSRFGLRRALVVLQVALSLVLLTGALLFGRSLRNLTTLDIGFQQDGLLIAQLDASHLQFTPERRTVYYDNLLARLRSTPGVEHVATAAIVQLSGSSWNPPVEMLDMPSSKGGQPWFNRISPGYFETMGTPMLTGRDFNDRDTLASTEVAIVSQKFREKYMNGADPIGKRFRVPAGPGEKSHIYQIVGMVKDSKYKALSRDLEPLVFLAANQEAGALGTNLIIRSRESLGPLTAAVKSTILGENSGAEILFQVFKTQVSESILRERLMATLSGFFGVLAALLASVGLYGVISYMVARRKNEIGIRVALGADRMNIVRLVIREAAILLCVGLVIGIALTASGASITKSLLYGLKGHDPVTIASAVGLLALVSLGASVAPALRASRLDPIDALREE